MVFIQRDVEDRRSVDDMDIVYSPYDVDEVPEAEDDKSEEAPSERDNDTESNGETPQTHYSDDNAPICQTPLEEPMFYPYGLDVSPLQAKLLDFASSSQGRNRPPHLNDDEAETYKNDVDECNDDQDDEGDHKDVDHRQLDVVSESGHSERDNDQHPQLVPSPLRPTTSDVVPSGAMDTPQRTSRALSRASAKDRHKCRHIAPMEPAITEDVLEEMIMRILRKTLPGLLLSLLKDAMAYRTHSLP